MFSAFSESHLNEQIGIIKYLMACHLPMYEDGVDIQLFRTSAGWGYRILALSSCIIHSIIWNNEKFFPHFLDHVEEIEYMIEKKQYSIITVIPKYD